MAKLPPPELAQQFFEQSLDLLCVAGTDGYFKYMNPAWSMVLGFSIEELKAKPFIDFVHPDDVESTLKESEKLASGTHTAIQFQNRYRTKDGRYLWLIWNICAHEGNLIAAAREITSLKMSETHLHNIQMAGKIGGWSLNTSTMEPKWTTETYHIHEVAPGTQFEVEKAIEFYTPEERPRIAKYVQDCIEKRIPFDDIFELITAKGNHIWVRSNGVPVVDGQGRVIELVGTFQDITESQRITLELDRSNKRIEGIINNSPGMVYQYKINADQSSYFPFVSQQAYEIYEVTPEQFQADPAIMVKMVHPEDVDGLTSAIGQSAANLTPFEWEGRIISGTGITKHILARSIPETTDDGGILWDGIVLDISRQVDLKEQLEQEQKKVYHASKLASIGELAAGVGHEINNPLAITMGNLSRIRKRYRQTGELDLSLLDDMEEAMDRIAQIVNVLRNYARIDQEDGATAINIHEQIDKSMSLVKEIYSSDGIEVKTEFDANSIKIMAHAGRFQQVMMNILVNAKDAVAEIKNPKITIQTQNDGEQIKIHICDNGVGMSPEVQDRVFESFFTTKPMGQGTGMGLAISRELILNMGGEIHFDSQVGTGTTFCLVFPTVKTDITSLSKPEPHSSHQFTGTALVVDDEPIIREILQEELDDLGLTVTVAENGWDALKRLESDDFDYVFSDLKMPDISGFELIQKAKELANQKTLCFILTGGVDSFHKSESNWDNVCDGTILKPFSQESITKAILTAQERSKAA